MKYFMTVWSHARNGERHFEMTLEQAEYYYDSWMRRLDWLGSPVDNISGVIAEAFKNGSLITAPKDKPAHMKIWGKEMSDAELFRLRIKGEIDKERLDEF